MHHYRSCEGVNIGFQGRGAPVLKVDNIKKNNNKLSFYPTILDGGQFGTFVNCSPISGSHVAHAKCNWFSF